jgi:NAD(P)H-hydrate repair Nnr-like enzyme with NAD(P)H-hydrate epimerase domain
VPSHVDLEPGQTMGIRIAADHLVVFQAAEALSAAPAGL